MIKKVWLLSMLLASSFVLLYTHAGSSSTHNSINLVDFKFEKRDLKDILNEFAQLKGINILYSSTTQLNTKVSFDAGKKITFSKAWELLLMMLEMAGFSLINQGGDLYALIGVDLVNVTPLPTYININVDELPMSQERVRYIYYCKNISLANQQSEISAVLKNFFDPKTFAQQLVLDINFNAIIITAKAETVKTAMKFIDIFDQSGEPQVADVFQLAYASSTEVATLLTGLINNQETSKGGKPVTAKSLGSTDPSFVFSPSTKIVSLFGEKQAQGTPPSSQVSSNMLVIIGRKSDVLHVKKFIKDHLDVQIEQGKSFFHVVELQWLTASVMASILSKLVTPAGASGQSTNVSLSQLAFDPQIKIVQEAVTQGVGANSGDLSQPLATGNPNNVQRGSNKLIIAATQKDWVRIQDVIDRLDIPQKQVIIETLILDLSVNFTRKLAAQMRTNGFAPSLFPKSMQAQAAMLAPILATSPANVADSSLQADLSAILGILTPASTNANDQSVNSTLFMIGDAQNTQGIWGFFQLLALHNSSKTVSRAFVVAQNNTPAVVNSSYSKRLPGKLTAGVTATIAYQTVTAPVEISFTPLISKNNVVNLQLHLNINAWADPANGASGNGTTREVQTNFSLKNGQVAVLGGLTTDRSSVSMTSVPWVSQIPIIGSLFSSKDHSDNKEKLFMLVRVTVTEPRLEGGMGKVSRRMASVANHMLNEDSDELFGTLKDPISRWIFEQNGAANDNGLPLHDLFMKSQSL